MTSVPAALGQRRLFGPVRPTAKHLEPFTPVAEYTARRTAEVHRLWRDLLGNPGGQAGRARRGPLVLILYESAKPATTVVGDRQPKGLRNG